MIMGRTDTIPFPTVPDEGGESVLDLLAPDL